ncbi:MAG: WD40/YVTN/BNR-like repeat-containing protein [Acidobacteriota bacterium]
MIARIGKVQAMRKIVLGFVTACLSLALLGRGVPASAAANQPNVKAAAPESSLSELLAAMKYRNIGPYRGGRSTAVTGVRGESRTFYFGGTGGGVWKTVDDGANWQPVSDKDFKTGSVGALAVAGSDPNVVYAGMGESPIRANLSAGDGVYRSTDAGKTWTNVGLRDAGQISRVVVHPKNPDDVYVAVQGHAWGPNAERGVYRSEDGGKTWKRVLFVDDRTGACDLAMDPNNPRVLFAAMWQAVRHPWEFVSGGPGSGLYRSTDGGDTWKKLTEGLPKGVLGRIGVTVSGARPGRVWAIVEAQKGGVYRSDDGGEKWVRVNGEHKLRERAWYYSWIYADPKNADTVWVPNVVLYRSIDGGITFGKVKAPHGDNHDLWIDPDDPSRMILGNDGGATITSNAGGSWSTEDNQPTAQFYRVATDDRFPYWVYGAQQDNSTVAIPSGVHGDAIGPCDWHDVGGGESGWVAPELHDPDIVYAGGYFGAITRYDHRTQQSREIDPWPQLASGHAVRDLKYRFNWNAPLLISRHDPKVLYFAAQKLLKSADGGQSWAEISPDLTRNDAAKQGYSGGPVSHDISGAEVYDTIFALAESPLEPGILWTGSDDGLVHLTRDGGSTWHNVTPVGLPEWIQINAIEASPVDPATAYIAATMYKVDDDRPYIYKTHDYGKSWTKIVEGLPGSAFTRVVREDPARRGLLYAGTERGIYVSFDDGARWRSLQLNLPAVPVTDLAVKNGDLVVATQGRAFWILDDLSPLRDWNDSLAAADVKLLAPRETYRFLTAAPEDGESARAAGTNMPGGVIVNYWLKTAPKEGEKLALEFLANGKVLRRFTNVKNATDEAEGGKPCPCLAAERDDEKEVTLEPKAGLNRFVWDMRIFKPTLVPHAVFNEGTKKPPEVPPGAYEVRLTVGDRSFTAPVTVAPHPGATATAADLKAQYDLLFDIQASLSETHATVLKVRDLEAQIKGIAEHAEKIGKGEPLKAKAAALEKALAAVEGELTNPEIQADEDDLNYLPKLDHDFAYLAGVVSTADTRPTDADTAYFGVLKAKLAAVLQEYQRIVDRDLADFNGTVAAAGVPAVVALPKAGERN